MRVRLFNKEFPKGRLFTDANELKAAEKSGLWVDAEHKVNNDKEYIATPVPENEIEPTSQSTSQLVDLKLCECGCGTAVNPGKRFAVGHYQKWLKNNKEKKSYDHRQDYKPSD